MGDGMTIKTCTRLGRTAEDQIVTLTKWGFTHFYNIWLADVEEFGREEGKLRYQKVWEELFHSGFESAKQAMGVTGEIDIPTLGRLRHFMSDSYPQPHDIIEIGPEKYVGHIKWCPNPVYSVPDTHIRKMDYYRDEYDITVFLAWKLVEWAGLKDKVEGKFTKAMCLGDDVCEWIFEAKSGDMGE